MTDLSQSQSHCHADTGGTPKEFNGSGFGSDFQGFWFVNRKAVCAAVCDTVYQVGMPSTGNIILLSMWCWKFFRCVGGFWLCFGWKMLLMTLGRFVTSLMRAMRLDLQTPTPIPFI